MIGWRNKENAIRFVVEVALLAVERAKLDEADQHMLKEFLAFIQQGVQTAPEFLDGKCPVSVNPFALFDEFKANNYKFESFEEAKRDLSITTLVREAFLLWKRRSGRSVANTTERWTYQLAEDVGVKRIEVSNIEMRHRLIDLDPEGRLAENPRLAFQAAWAAGYHKVAVRIVRRRYKETKNSTNDTHDDKTEEHDHER